MADPTPADSIASQPVPLAPRPDRVRLAAPLPTSLTSFVRREHEVAQIAALLRREDVRLLTLTGPGGVGKTRLALHVTEKLKPLFTDGVGFVDLTPLGVPDDVAPTIARALGLRETDNRPAGARLVDALRDRHLLLVLDNFEHVVEAAPLVAEVLRAALRLTVLVTSRTTLRLSGEHVFPVPPMSLLAPDRGVSVATAGQTEAVELFLARAQAVMPNFTHSDENAVVITEICQRLDGLPLAIELAAARIPVLTPRALLARLDGRLPLLTGGPRDAPERLQTVRGAIAWSYDLLSAEEQILLQRLAVFAGGCMLAAAEAIAGGELDVLEGISTLVAKSLLRQDVGPDGEPRYRMLETIREYALERLAASDEVDVVSDRLLAWCLARAEPLGRRWDIPRHQGDKEWFDTWDQEHPNVRAVLAWAEARGEAERCLRLAGSLFHFWWARNHLAEARGWLERGLAAGVPVSPAVRAHALAVLSAITHRQGDNELAAHLAREASWLWSEIGDGSGVGFACYLLGIALYRQGDLHGAGQGYREALALARTAGDDAVAGEALLGLAQIARDRDDLRRAAEYYEEALQVQSAGGISWGAALTHYGYATVVQARGDPTRALMLYRHSLRFWRAIGDDGSVAVCLEGIASALCSSGTPARAARLLGAAHALRKAIGYPVPWRALASHGALLGSVRSCLNERLFAEAWLGGLRLSIDEAIAEATAPLPATVGADHRMPADRSPVQPQLTRRERDVLRLVTAGHSDRQIAEALFISRRTASEHVSHILHKLGAKSRADAAAHAIRHRLA